MSSAARPGIRLPGWMADRARDVLEGRSPPAAPRDAATVMLLRPPRRGGARAGCSGPDAPGMEVYMLRRQSSMAFAPGRFRVPWRLGGSPRRRHRGRPGPARTRWSGAGCSAPRPNWPGPWSAPRSGRPSRNPGCCWPGRPPDTVVADTRGEDWEADRPRCWPVAVAGRPAPPARPGPAQRPAAALVAVDHPGDRGAPVRHQVLRGRAARRPADQGRRRRGRRCGLGRARRRARRRAAPEGDLPDAADRRSPWASWAPAARVGRAQRPPRGSRR